VDTLTVEMLTRGVLMVEALRVDTFPVPEDTVVAETVPVFNVVTYATVELSVMMFPVSASTVPKSPNVAWTSSRFWIIEVLRVEALRVEALRVDTFPVPEDTVVAEIVPACNVAMFDVVELSVMRFPVRASTVKKLPNVAWTSLRFWTIEALMVEALRVLALNVLASPVKQSKVVVSTSPERIVELLMLLTLMSVASTTVDPTYPELTVLMVAVSP